MNDMYEFSVEWPSTSAQSVIVTGDFDKWSKSRPLRRSSANNHFTGTIKVPYGCPTRYKFIVDGEWKVRQEEPTELSPEGFLNNIYYVPPLEHVFKPQPSTAANGVLGSQENGNAGAGVTRNVKSNASSGQTETTIDVHDHETTSSQTMDKPIDIPATTEPTTSPANDAVANPESTVTQSSTNNTAIAPIIPMPIIPVNAKENCTIDPTKVVSNEDNIGTFVGVKLAPKKAEEEDKEEGEVERHPDVPVIVLPLTEGPKEPLTEEVTKEPDAVPVQEETATPTPGEVKEVQTSEATPVQEETPAPAPAATQVKADEGAPQTEEPAEPKKEAEEPKPETSSATPTPDTPKPPSKFVEGANANANGHTRTASETSTAVKPTSSPTVSSTAPGTTLAESVTSGSSAPGNNKTEQNGAGPAATNGGGDTKEFGVKQGKGSMKSGKKRKSSFFGSLRKIFHHEKDKKTNGSA